MTQEEKKNHMQNLALAVYVAHKAYKSIEALAKHEGLNCDNKQNMWFEGSRGKVISVLVNGELK